MTRPSGARLHEFSVGVRVQLSPPFQSLAVLGTVGPWRYVIQGGLSVKWAFRYHLEPRRQFGIVVGPLFLVATVERPGAGRLVS